MKKIKMPNKKILILSFIVLAGIAFISFLYLSKSENSEKTTNPTSSQEAINFNPATEEDKKRADDNKQQIVDKQNQTPPSGSEELKASVFITYAGQYGNAIEVGGYANVFEEGGNCTAIFTQAGNVVTKRVEAIRGAKSVDCPVISANIDEFPTKGTYSVMLSYASPKSSGSSEARLIEIK
jgi:hypothetical protein